MSDPSKLRPADLLAHGPGFMLLDHLSACDAETARCLVEIRPGIPFYEADAGVPGWVGVEYMAQTIGVHAGWLRLQRGLDIVPGLLLGTRSYDCEAAYFAPGTRLNVVAELLVTDASGVGVYRCTIDDGATVYATADIKAFQPDDMQSFLDQLYASPTPQERRA
ncbi:3-hydroxylacyl-ACP dehydratase [Sinimarinibacterium sp. CAU 1509]|uniref:ApeP family dehydratase n=1 Tax=Sinimarinibacterium sp. CAU 1509 TaxID=2562283 RepID=UPI0010AD96ED|nr:3-hydroxylacyl-ACP dehydratase [Sinimarinibacterium sp. CAU 1509]TJY58287.1 3-hydroxylacyl-ACP dehydratase [Sinimarinibacterium sp. CAU 1509]